VLFLKTAVPPLWLQGYGYSAGIAAVTSLPLTVALGTLDVPRFNSIFGRLQWGLAVGCLWYNIPNTRVVYNSITARNHSGVYVQIGTPTSLTNSTGGTASAYVENTVTASEVIAAAATFADRRAFLAPSLYRDAGTNITVYATTMRAYSLDDPEFYDRAEIL